MELISEELTCPICQDLLNLPLTFTCSHSVCKECCSRFFDGLTENRFACPVCKEVHLIPDKGVEEYRLNRCLSNIVDILRKSKSCDYSDKCQNLAEWYCQSCDNHMCEECLDTHKKSRVSRRHEANLYIKAKSGKQGDLYHCLKHEKEVLISYCTEKHTVVCQECELEERHKNHSHLLLSSNKLKKMFQADLIRLQEAVDRVSNVQSRRQENLRVVIEANNKAKEQCSLEIKTYFAEQKSVLPTNRAISGEELLELFLDALQQDASQVNQGLHEDAEDLAEYIRRKFNKIIAFSDSLKSRPINQIALQRERIEKHFEQLDRIAQDLVEKHDDVVPTNWVFKVSLEDFKFSRIQRVNKLQAKIDLMPIANLENELSESSPSQISVDHSHNAEIQPAESELQNEETKGLTKPSDLSSYCQEDELKEEPVMNHKSETDPLSGLPSTEIAPTVTDTHEPANDVDNPSEPSTKCRPPDSQDTYSADHIKVLSSQSIDMLRSEMKEMNKTTYERLHADLMEIKSIMSGVIKPIVQPAHGTLHFKHKSYFPDCTIAGEKTYFIQGSHLQSLNWERYGFKMRFPANTLLFPDDYCEISVLALIGGNFVYPEDTELVSCVYSVALSKRINDCVGVEIEHCVSLREESDCSQLMFAASDKTNHQIFKAVEGAKFCVSSGYGVVEQMHFCRRSIGIFRKSRHTPTRYSGFLLSQVTGRNRWLTEFIAFKNIKAYEQFFSVERLKVRQSSVKFEFSSNDKNRVLKLDMSAPIPEGWKLYPECDPLTISQSDIDTSENQKDLVQSCQIDVHRSEEAVEHLYYPIKLMGIQECSTEKIYINLPLPEPYSGMPHVHTGIPLCLSGDISAVDPDKFKSLVNSALRGKIVSLSDFLTPLLDKFKDKMIQVDLVSSYIPPGATYDTLMQQFRSSLTIDDNVQSIKQKCCKLFQVFTEMGGTAKNFSDQIKKDLNEQLQVNMF